MSNNGPFLWLSPKAPPAGFRNVPSGGMCLCAFLFVRRGERILLGKYADHPHWEELAGLDRDRRRANANGWTLPASHLKFGEDPRNAARRIGEEILQLPDLRYEEPVVEVDAYEPLSIPGELHYDVWFFVDAFEAGKGELSKPDWYGELDWLDPRTTPSSAYARQHEDVVSRWLKRRAGLYP